MPSPEELEQLRTAVEQKGFTLVGDGANGVFTAALLAPFDPEVSSASTSGLLDAIDSYWQRQLSTKPGWKDAPRTVVIQ